MIDRRCLIGSSAAFMLTAPLIGHAQPERKVRRIGILGNFVDADATGAQPSSPYTGAFLRGMREHGYVYGEHFVTEPRGSAGNAERFPALAAEMVGLQVDVIVAAGQALPALKRATSTILIVMTAASNPVGQGYVQSLAHPGTNMTGLSLQTTEMTAKRLELIKQLVPEIAPVAVLWDRE